ncbi:MAG: thiamine ABC transporter substrate-binding protein [Actinomycetota bacterium]|nr:thiamine ABC transporter substrate-binding protein [Actinomycetota bacterium]MDP2287701.1 thiamine ABC transporter substrate-binding protein [Actinomycetota bacterium]
MRFHASKLMIGLVLSGGLVLGACSSAEPSSPETSGPTTVRLLAHDSFVVSESLLEQFKKDTGITIEVMTAGDAGAMVAGAVLAAGSPSADVMFGIDNTLLSKAVDAEVFSPYTASDADSIVPELRDDTSGGVVTPIDYGDVCINIDDTWFAKNQVPVPINIDQLTGKKYKDLLVVEDPASSSPGLAFMLATIAKYGENWPQYWEQLNANGVKVSGSWTDAYESVFSAGRGDRPLVVSYATSPPAEIVYAEQPKPSKPSTSVLTDGCYRQIEFAGVLRGTPNEAAARKVVDWLLSAPVQADVPLSMFVFPSRANVPLPPVFTKFAARVANPLQLSAADVNAHLSEWLKTWGQVMGR